MAGEQDFRVVLAEDAVSGVYDRGMDELRDVGMSVMSAGDLVAAIPTR